MKPGPNWEVEKWEQYELRPQKSHGLNEFLPEMCEKNFIQHSSFQVEFLEQSTGFTSLFGIVCFKSFISKSFVVLKITFVTLNKRA